MFLLVCLVGEQVAVDSRVGGRGAGNGNVKGSNAPPPGNVSLENTNGAQESVVPFEVKRSVLKWDAMACWWRCSGSCVRGKRWCADRDSYVVDCFGRRALGPGEERLEARAVLIFSSVLVSRYTVPFD